MTIIEKYPYSEFKLIYVDSNKLSDLSDELKTKFTAIHIGRGYVILKQTFSDRDSDEFNFKIKEDDKEIFGRCYIVKAGKEKLLEVTEDTIEEILNYLK